MELRCPSARPPPVSGSPRIQATVTLARARVELLFGSFTVLFQELALIRALPTQVRVLGYFPNLILISAFLGLGVGALRARGKSLMWVWPFSLLLIASVSALMSGVAFTANEASEHLWLLYSDLPANPLIVESVQLPIVVMFVLSTLTFIPLGQLVADRLNVFRRESAALWGYSFDLLGSLVGVVLFSVASFLHSIPTVWYAVVFASGAVFFVRRLRIVPVYLAVAATTLLIVHGSDRNEQYSPYYALTVKSDASEGGAQVLANGSLHQVAWSMRRDVEPVSEGNELHRRGLHYPYEVLQETPRNVLVLGAGTGNDIAVLLDRGVEKIDAVEIDPTIVELGRRIHPDRPYDSPRVTIHNTDARSFLNDSREQYDLIVFGTLDSMTRLSALSAVRLDNFVYTKESLASARARLAPGGGLVLFFWAEEVYIHDHLRDMLTDVFGAPPIVHAEYFRMLNHIYLAGPRFQDGAEEAPVVSAASGRPVPTDDWPYLYLPSRFAGGTYLSLLGILLTIAVVTVMASSSDFLRGVRDWRWADPEMFLYGFAFLLMETRYVTEMNLLWGATWLTSAVVFGSILFVVLAGTIAMQLRPVSFNMAFAGLVVSILVTYLVPTGALITQSQPMRLALSIVYVGGPVLCASVCFALRFRSRVAPDLAFGWNLLGAVMGGLTELFSMVVGLKALLLVALAAYLTSLLAARRTVAAPAPSG